MNPYEFTVGKRRPFLIDDEFQHVLPPQTDEATKLLAEAIELEGPLPGSLRIAYVASEKKLYLIDGHNTLRICETKRLASPMPIKLANFANREQVVEWIKVNARRKRNLTEVQLERLRRIERVTEARAEGQSTRTIAEGENVSQQQVRRDLEKGVELGVRPPPTSQVPSNGRVTGQDGKSYPAVVSIYCDRCARVGPIKDCPKCEQLRIEQGRRKKPLKKKKPGSVLFDWAEFDRHYGHVARGPDEVGRAYHLESNSTEFHACQRLLTEFRKVWEQWKKRLSKHQPAPTKE